MQNKEIEEAVHNEIEKTKKSITEYKEMTKPVEPDVAIGRISRIDAINNKSVIEASLRLAQEKLSNLERVLTELKGDHFGLCMKCKNPIPIARILIRPESLYCVNCAS